MRRTNRLVGITLVAVLTASTNLMAAHILSLDASRTGNEGETGADRYLTSTSMANATSVLTAAGFTIGTTGQFTAANTAGANVLFTGAVDTAFTAQELTDIAAFVSAGGGLVMMRDWGSFYPVADPLAAVFGATYNPGGFGAPVSAVNLTVAHPIWNGPAGSVATYNQVFSSSVAGVTGIGDHSTNPGQVGLAYTTPGLGRVVFLTDMDAWDDLGDTESPTPGSNNAIVWENIFHFAASPALVPEPSTLIIWSLLGILGIGWLRRRKA